MNYKFVIIYPEYKNLPPQLGIYNLHHHLSKVYNNVEATINYIYYNYENIQTGTLPLHEFMDFIKKEQITTIVHSTTKGSYYFKALLTKVIQSLLLKHYLFIPAYNLYRRSNHKHINDVVKEYNLHNKNKITIMECLEKNAYCMVETLTQQNYYELYKKYRQPLCKVEILYSNYPEFPNPITWIRTNYQPTESNEYTEFMSSYNFDLIRHFSKSCIYNTITSLY